MLSKWQQKNISFVIVVNVLLCIFSYYVKYPTAAHKPFSHIRLHVRWAVCKHLLFIFPLRSPVAGGMKEQDLMCIKLHGVNRIGLKKIIDFIYTAKLSLNMENLQDTLEAASFLQILPVLDFCKVFLISGVRKQAHKPTSIRAGTLFILHVVQPIINPYTVSVFRIRSQICVINLFSSGCNLI